MPVVRRHRGIADRVVALPVPEGAVLAPARGERRAGLAARAGYGNLGLGGARPTDEDAAPVLERFDFGRHEACQLADDVDWFEASGDGTRLVISDHGS